MHELRAHGKTLERIMPRKIYNLHLSDGILVSVESKSPFFLRRLQMPILIEHVNHRKVRKMLEIMHPGFVACHRSGKV
jgi:hypothetical protein